MIPLWTVGGQKILGFPMNQNRLAVPTWSYAMEVYPPARIIEIGAYNGGFTLALALHAWHLGCKVHSWDVCEAPSEQFRPLRDALRVSFYQRDCFHDEKLIGQLIGNPGVTYLLCDGGNKPKEFNTFAKYLKPGDVIGAHDYLISEEYWVCGEIWQRDVADTVFSCRLFPFMQEHFDLAAWLVYQQR